MTTYNDRVTADYSPLLVHFTAQRKMMMPVDDLHPLAAHRQSSAKDKLLSVLRLRTIYASPMPHLAAKPEAVCFTECIWDGLVELSDVSYSPYGVVLRKKLIHDRGGGPALYVRGDSIVAFGARIPDELAPMIAPFDPDAHLQRNVPLDWIHEREWRLPRSLEFEHSDLIHVLVDTVDDVVEISALTDLPARMFIPMEVYRTIKKAWPSKAGG